MTICDDNPIRSAWRFGYNALWITRGMLWCADCGSYVAVNTRGLADHCSAIQMTENRRRSLRRLGDGKHPETGRHIWVPMRIPRWARTVPDTG